MTSSFLSFHTELYGFLISNLAAYMHSRIYVFDHEDISISVMHFRNLSNWHVFLWTFSRWVSGFFPFVRSNSVGVAVRVTNASSILVTEIKAFGVWFPHQHCGHCGVFGIHLVSSQWAETLPLLISHKFSINHGRQWVVIDTLIIKAENYCLSALW